MTIKGSLFLAIVIVCSSNFVCSQTQAKSKRKKYFLEGAKYTAGLRGGNFLGGAVGIGVGFGFQFRNDFSVEFVAMDGAISLEKQDSYQGVTTEELSAGASQYYFRAAYHFLQPMFIAIGLGQRQINATTKVVSSFDKSSVASDISIRSNVMVLDFGSKWIFAKRYLLGVDWVSLSIPFHKYGDSRTKSEGQTTNNLEDLSKKNEAAAENLGNASIFGLLVLNASYQF